ncbi:MAG: prolipoprotein diacylglyceryl transferase [Gammaproteobacteria bacterium RIFCSPHIGHO2_12_FULL_41_15]|nr:MAG: prolipoprotein diacylglyceryl transferase [Gammaproteobacteria bacterium RIFCSPHIGHO2_12_FULL_41_15]
MIPYPHINPIAIEIGPLKIHWYGLAYLFGIGVAWLLALYRARKPNSRWNAEQVGDLVFCVALGVILGGRIGYMLFYDFSDLIQHPLDLFKVWDGGMSFHGGFLGVLLSMYILSKKTKRHFWDVMDFIAPFVPVGLGAGRIANFINGELWGRVTNVPWAMVFPHTQDQLPRHPSALYEFLLEGVLFFAIMWIFSSKPRPRMAVSGVFSLCYGLFRFVVEFFRQPDQQLGFVAFGWMTRGQELSIPMIVAGMIILVWAYKRS